MLESMSETGPSISDADIAQLERLIRAPLPKSYRQFLAKYNGGKPTPDCFPILNYTAISFGGINYFFRLRSKIKSSNIDWNYEIFRNRVPDGYLPIAGDGSGNILFMALSSCRTSNEGVIVFWDHESEHSPPTSRNMYSVALSFDDLLSQLHRRDIKAEIAKARARRHLE